MATSKPRVQGYIPAELAQTLLEWRKAHNLSESQALAQIIQAFFAGQTVNTLFTSDSTPLSELVAEVEELRHRVEVVNQDHVQLVETLWGGEEADVSFDAVLEALDYHQKFLESLHQSLQAQSHATQTSVANLQAQIDELRDPNYAAMDPGGSVTWHVSGSCAFQVGDWVKYYSRGQNLVEQIIEITPTDQGIHMLLLPSGRIIDGEQELDRFPETMVVPYIAEVNQEPSELDSAD